MRMEGAKGAGNECARLQGCWDVGAHPTPLRPENDRVVHGDAYDRVRLGSAFADANIQSPTISHLPRALPIGTVPRLANGDRWMLAHHWPGHQWRQGEGNAPDQAVFGWGRLHHLDRHNIRLRIL